MVKLGVLLRIRCGCSCALQTPKSHQLQNGADGLRHQMKNSLVPQDWKYAQELENCTAAMDRIHKYRYLNAFTFVSSWKSVESQWENFRQQKQAAASGPGKLAGLPIAIKDNFCLKGVLTTCGSKMLQNFVPPYTATVVQKMMDAGAIIIGKTNMDEFGMGCATVDTIFGPSKNIWGLESFGQHANDADKESKKFTTYSDWRIPGGSSGGSALAVATGMCFAALGSDTGGSTRNPASYCGIVGFKPTYGLLSRYGLIPLVNSLDVPGILTRTVDDCARVLDIVKGYDDKDSTSVNVNLAIEDLNDDADIETFAKNIRIGLPKEFTCSEMTQEVKDCWNDISNLMRESGVSKVEEVSLPHTKYSIACYSVLNPCEVASNMARYDGLRFGHRAMRPRVNSTEGLYSETRHEGFNEVVRGRILAGNYFLLKQNYDRYFVQAMKVRRLIANDFDKVWSSGFDVLLAPVTLSAPPKYSEFMQFDNRTQTSIQDYCTQSTNLAGLPAISLPIKTNSEGLPLSLQLIGPKFSENTLLKLAKFIENRVNFPHFYREAPCKSKS